MKAYKLLFRHPKNNCLISFGVLGKAEVKYQLNKWAKAPDWLAKKGYHLLAFDTLQSVKEHTSDKLFFVFDYNELWEVEATGIIKKLPPFLDINKLQSGKMKKDKKENWVKGTIMAKRIKLIKRIK